MDSVAVLLSVYAKDDPKALRSALESLWTQTYPVDIFVQQDGTLPEPLAGTLQKAYANGKIAYLGKRERNLGLAESLNELLAVLPSRYALVARMDADDISISHRIEKQVRFMRKHPEISVVGAWICEFDTCESECERERRVPTEHDAIVAFAQYRNPMNHVSVLFRKEAVEAAGGYEHMNGFEDYFLWIRMLQKGYCFANIPEVLVKVRGGREMARRRRGWSYFKDEVRFITAVKRLGFFSLAISFRNVIIRAFPRLLPLFIVERLYNLLRK